jgi:hypothetical protein
MLEIYMHINGTIKSGPGLAELEAKDRQATPLIKKESGLIGIKKTLI